MVKCTFCGSEVIKGSGKIFVRDNGQVLNFCSMKCEKNMLVLKRDARKLKWTAFFEKGAAPSQEKKAKVAKKVAEPKKAPAAKKTTIKKK